MFKKYISNTSSRRF